MLSTVASTVLPGTGLLRTRYRAVGWAILGLFAAILIAGLTLVLTSQDRIGLVAEIASSAQWLMWIAVGGTVLALVWIAQIILTHRVTEPESPAAADALAMRGLTGILCLAVAVPSVVAIRVPLVSNEVADQVFTNSNIPSSDTTAAPVAKPDPWEGVQRVNVLLLGSDAGSDRTGVRTDSMIVASINAQTGDTVLIGVPRSLQRVPFPDDNPLQAAWPNGFNCGAECLMTNVWMAAVNRPDLFVDVENSGLVTTRGVIEEVLGLEVDYTTIVDLKGFEGLVNAMGGVTVNVLEDTPIYGPPPGYVTREIIKKGEQELDGYHALWYARSRRDSDDYSRMNRQRCVVGAVVSQVNPVTMLSKFNDIAVVVKNNVKTDIPRKDLPAWATLVNRVQGSSIRSLTLTPANISTVNPDFAQIHTLVRKALKAPKPASTSSPTTKPSSSPTTKPSSAVDLQDAC